MGHYDDCYEADAERNRREAGKLHKKLNKQAETHLFALDRIVDEFNLDDDLQKHMENKILELRALFYFLVNA